MYLRLSSGHLRNCDGICLGRVRCAKKCMEEEKISLVQECANKYAVEELNDNEVEIRIRIPRRFRTLWLVKLSELKTDRKETDEFKDN